LGALCMALAKRRLTKKLLVEALDNTTRLTAFVMFILIGSTVFSFTFNAADGQAWIGHLFDKLPGGVLGFLLVVNVLVFVLGMFIDFFEIAFIVVPLLVPVANALGIDLVWFGVILAMNLQTSFLTPPFGFALFYLRSVAPNGDTTDRITGARIPAVTTTQIYKGSIAFIFLQLLMVAAIIRWPGLVLDQIDAAPAALSGQSLQLPDAVDANGEDDPMRDLLEVIRREQAASKAH
ncbi:MAG: TRAP transporter large permease subunit, partial [Rugosibacter sp.]